MISKLFVSVCVVGILVCITYGLTHPTGQSAIDACLPHGGVKAKGESELVCNDGAEFGAACWGIPEKCFWDYRIGGSKR